MYDPKAANGTSFLIYRPETGRQFLAGKNAITSAKLEMYYTAFTSLEELKTKWEKRYEESVDVCIHGKRCPKLDCTAFQRVVTHSVLVRVFCVGSY